MMPPGWRGLLADGFCLTGDDVWSSRLASFAAFAAQAFAGKLNAMSVVNEAVEDRVGVGGIGDDFMPAVHGKLRRDDRRAAAVSLFEDFEEIMAGAGVEGFEAEVVEDQEIGAPERAQDARMAPIAARQGKVFAELGPTMIDDGAIVATGLVAERRSQPTFPDAGRPDEGQIVVGFDPLALDELLEQRAVETARAAVIDVFDAGLLPQFGVAQSRCKPLVLAPRRLAVEQEPQPFMMAKAVCFIGVGDFDEGLGHAMQAQGVELVEGWMFEQDRFS